MQRWNKNKVTPPHQKATSVEPSATFPVGWTPHALGAVTFPVARASGFLAHAADVCMANSVGKSKTNLLTLHTMVNRHDALASSTPENTPTIKKTPRSIQNATAKAMLVLSLTTGAPAPVQAQEPTNSSVSAIASADKGGQVVSIDGKDMSFAEIAQMDQAEQERVISEIEGVKTRLLLKSYLVQAANQRIGIKKWAEQSANQRIEQNNKDMALSEALGDSLQYLKNHQWGGYDPENKKHAIIIEAVLANSKLRAWLSPESVHYLESHLPDLKNGYGPKLAKK